MRGLRGLANRAGAFFSGLRGGFADGRRRSGHHDDPALRYGLATCSEPGCDWAALVSVESWSGRDPIGTTREEHVRRDHPEAGQDPLS